MHSAQAPLCDDMRAARLGDSPSSPSNPQIAASSAQPSASHGKSLSSGGAQSVRPAGHTVAADRRLSDDADGKAAAGYVMHKSPAAVSTPSSPRITAVTMAPALAYQSGPLVSAAALGPMLDSERHSTVIARLDALPLAPPAVPEPAPLETAASLQECTISQLSADGSAATGCAPLPRCAETAGSSWAEQLSVLLPAERHGRAVEKRMPRHSDRSQRHPAPPTPPPPPPHWPSGQCETVRNGLYGLAPAGIFAQPGEEERQVVALAPRHGTPAAATGCHTSPGDSFRQPARPGTPLLPAGTALSAECEGTLTELRTSNDFEGAP